MWLLLYLRYQGVVLVVIMFQPLPNAVSPGK